MDNGHRLLSDDDRVIADRLWWCVILALWHHLSEKVIHIVCVDHGDE